MERHLPASVVLCCFLRGWYSELWVLYFQSSGFQTCATASSLCSTGAGTWAFECAEKAVFPGNHGSGVIVHVFIFSTAGVMVEAGLTDTEF